MIQSLAQSSGIYSRADDYLNTAQELYLRGYYDSSVVFYKIATKMYNNESRPEKELYCNIRITHCYIDMEIPDSTDYYYNKVVEHENKLADKSRLMINYLHLKSKYRLYKNEYKDIISYLETAKKKAETVYDPLLLSINCYYFGRYYLEINKVEESFEYFKKALTYHENQNIEDINTVNYHQFLAYLYFHENKYKLALSHIDQSIRINKKIEAPNRLLIWSLYSKGRSLNRTIQFDEAIEVLNEAEKVLAQNMSIKNFGFYQFYLLYELGRNYKLLDKHEMALSYYNKALDVANIQDDNNYRTMAYREIGFCNLDLKNYQIALDNYYRSVFIAEAVGDEKIQSQYLQIANIHKILKDYENAERFYLLAINAGKKRGKNLNDFYHDYGKFLIEIEKYDAAEEYLLQALSFSISQNGIFSYYTSRDLLGLGDYYYTTGETSKALKYYHNSINSFFKGYNTDDYLELPDKDNLPPFEYASECLGKKSFALVQVGKNLEDDGLRNKYFKAAMENYKLALLVLDKIKYEYKDLDYGYLLAENFKYIFEGATISAIEAYNQTHDYYYLNCAWEFSESNKAALIRAMYTDNLAREQCNIPEEIQNSENEIKKKISIYQRMIDTEKEEHMPDNEKVTEWSQLLLHNYTLLDSLTNMLEDKYPAYYDLKYNTEVIDIERLQENLTEDQIVIEYLLSQDNLITYLIANNQAYVTQQSIDSNFHKLIAKYNDFFRSDKYSYSNMDGFKEYTVTAYDLYKVLLLPIEQHILDKEITIIPDDILSLIPFEALLYEEFNVNYVDYKRAPYLIRKNPVHYEYAASFIKHDLKSRNRNVKILAIAPYYDSLYMNKVYEVDKKLQQEGIDYLVPLAGAYDEVSEIAKVFRTKMMLDGDASEERFRALAPDFQILHIAGHTLIDDDQPMYSKLLFTLNEDSTEDDFLNTFELYTQDLASDLVILSGCNTGIGKLRRGEGMISLSRGFIFAGCNSIIMTLWSVSDKSSATLMAALYRKLAEGLTKDEALRQAKLEYLQDADPIKAHPYYWAGYISIGNNDPLPKPQKYLLHVLFAVLAIADITTIMIITKRKAKA